MSRPARRKVADEAEARALLAQQEASGLSLSAWCKAEGVDGRSLGGWRAFLTPLRVVELDTPAPRAGGAGASSSTRRSGLKVRHRGNGTDIGWRWWRKGCGGRGSGRRRGRTAAR